MMVRPDTPPFAADVVMVMVMAVSMVMVMVMVMVIIMMMMMMMQNVDRFPKTMARITSGCGCGEHDRINGPNHLGISVQARAARRDSPHPR